jgi:hypothetical protein
MRRVSNVKKINKGLKMLESKNKSKFTSNFTSNSGSRFFSFHLYKMLDDNKILFYDICNETCFHDFDAFYG